MELRIDNSCIRETNNFATSKEFHGFVGGGILFVFDLKKIALQSSPHFIIQKWFVKILPINAFINYIIMWVKYTSGILSK
jgi:hypothetical protein